MAFRQLKLGNKQLAGFGLILLIMTGVNVFFINQIKDIKSGLDDVTDNWLQRVIAVSDLNNSASRLLNGQLELAIADSDSARDMYKVAMISMIDRIENQRDKYDTLRSIAVDANQIAERESVFFQTFDKNWEDYQQNCIDFMILIGAGQQEQALELLNNEGLPYFSAFSFNLDSLVLVNQQGAQLAAVNAATTFSETRKIALTLLIGTILFSVMLAGILVRWITVPVYQLQEAAQKVAGGDLSVQLQVQSRDEIGDLADSFNQMTASLRETTQKLRQQAAELERQQEVLKKSNKELAEKSTSLERQTKETQRKNEALQEALEQLSATQQQLLLQEKMASLGKLVAGVAHEINNPMATVNSSTDVITRGVAKIEEILTRSDTTANPDIETKLQRTLNILRDNIRVTQEGAARVTGIVNSLKTFAKLDEAEYQQADIREGLRSCLNLLGSDVHQRIDIALQLEDVPEIVCYPAQLNQVFLNLLKNAVEAIDGQGEVQIRTWHDKNYSNGNGRPPKEQVVVEITDNGRGIPSNMIDSLFEFNFSSGGGERIKLGSGLVTSYNIVQQHQGHIDVQSVAGEGSTFTVRLPVVSQITN